MSTRGLYGFRFKGVDKITYNAFDSDPGTLGYNFMIFCSHKGIEGLKSFFEAVILVNNEVPPTLEQVKYCKKNGWFEEQVYTESSSPEQDWKCLLYKLQGDFAKYDSLLAQNEKIYMLDNISFIRDSECDFAYIVNLDEEILEYYIGWQENPDSNNRYGTEKNELGNYPCKMVAKIPLKKINDTSFISLLVDVLNPIGQGGILKTTIQQDVDKLLSK